MFDGSDFLKIIKKAAVDAINTSQPSDFYFGRVISTSPLKVSVEQKMVLGAAQLVLTRNVTNFKTTVGVDWKTETNNANSASHNHSVSGTKEIAIHNALKVGEEVVLLKQKGGQKYLILDRVVGAS